MTLKQLQEKLDAYRAQMREVFDCKSTDDNGEVVYDFQAFDADWIGADVRKLEGSQKTFRILELVTEKNKECDKLSDQVIVLEKARQIEEALKKAEKTPVNRPAQPEGKKAERKSISQRIVGDPLFAKWREGSMSGQIKLDDVGLAEIKTLFETGAGWLPESTRTGQVVDAVTRPLQVIDIMPTGRTGQANVVYMLETTRTHAAAEKDEGAAYAESEFALTETTTPVRKITDSVPVTDEQLDDVPMAESYLEGRLMFGIMQRLDQQVISGNGAAPNLDGILNVAGIQNQPAGGDPAIDIIFKALKNVRVTGRAVPTHVLTHPNDWEEIRLLRTADGIYIWGNPSEAGPERIWGLPVVQNESLTEGVGLVGSFMPAWIQLVERLGVVVQMGFVNDDFTKGRKTLRASGRWALPVYRPPAFCTATGI